MAGIAGFLNWVEAAPGSPEELLENDRSGATRVYLGPWGERVAFVRAVLGGATVKTVGGTGEKYLSRQLPHAHPSWFRVGSAYEYYLHAVRASVEGLGARSFDELLDGERVATFEKAKVRVTYESLKYNVLDDTAMSNVLAFCDESTLSRYVEKDIAPAAQYLTLPTGAFKYVDPDTPTAGDNNAGKPIMTGVGKMLVFFNVSFTWVGVPDTAIPCAALNPLATGPMAIDLCLGRVNKDDLGNYNPGTLLLMACRIRPYRSPFGQRIFDIGYMFKYFEPRPNAGHNHIMRPRTNPTPAYVWYEASIDGSTNYSGPSAFSDGKSVYDFAEFRKLFRPAQ